MSGFHSVAVWESIRLRSSLESRASKYYLLSKHTGNCMGRIKSKIKDYRGRLRGRSPGQFPSGPLAGKLCHRRARSRASGNTH